MTLLHRLTASSAVIGLSASLALAEPAVIYDVAGKFDKSFSENVWDGALRWSEENGTSFAEFELQSDAQRTQAIRNFAEAGHSPIIMAGFQFAMDLAAAAPDYPDTKFVIIDAVVDEPNVRSVVFTEHEGTYLAGMIAAMTSESGTIGFVGGMDIPLIRRFGCGYVQGALSADPDVTVITNMIGTSPSAWADPVTAGELTRAQVAQGVDVVYAAAGGSGLGVHQAAADSGILSIGGDTNQNYLHPGTMLTSMLKRIDNAVFDALSEGDDMATGVMVMGLANGGLGYALDEFNAEFLTDEMVAAVDAAAEAISTGALPVHDYMSDESCPVHTF